MARRPREWRLLVLVVMNMVLICLVPLTLARPTPPEISSTHLQMHKIYTSNPSHDARLYEILQVPSNATAAQITKSYRRLSRQYHPDKGHQPAKLKLVQEAYDILKDDSTRLPYHQYGLIDPNVAVAILLGPHHQQSQQHLLDEAHHELLQLMGFEYFGQDYSSNSISRRERRIYFAAARLVERLRPLVEDSVSPRLVAHHLASDCDRWKRLPMGAHVIRCVGRAYRHAGRDYLQHKSNKSKANVVEHYSVPVRQQWRRAKAFWTAFMATGKATVTEQAIIRQEKRRKRIKAKRKQEGTNIDYHLQNLGNLQDNDDYDDEAMFSDNDDSSDLIEDDEEDRKFMEQFRAKQTLLTSLQVEALWKVAKIDLDTVVRRACRLVLTGEYFFFPSHQSMHDHDTTAAQGWVTSGGRILDKDEALRRTAEALIFLGDILVERSKAETAWKGS